jgi:PAS domain S-box-containing protein
MTTPTLSPAAPATAPAPQAALPATDGAFFSLFLDHPQPMWIYEIDTLRFMAVNPAAQRIYGYSAEEFAGMTVRELLPPSQQERFFAFLAEAPPPGHITSLWGHRCKDGDLIDVQVTAHALEFRGKRCRFVFANDVSAMMRVERALYKSEQLQRRLIDTLPHQIFWKYPDHSYAGCNVVFARAAGLAHPDQVVGKRDQDFHWAHNAERIMAEDSAIMATGVPMIEFEDQLLEPDGRIHDYVITKLPLYDQQGAIIGVLGTIEDVSARKLAGKNAAPAKQSRRIEHQRHRHHQRPRGRPHRRLRQPGIYAGDRLHAGRHPGPGCPHPAARRPRPACAGRAARRHARGARGDRGAA